MLALHKVQAHNFRI